VNLLDSLAPPPAGGARNSVDAAHVKREHTQHRALQLAYLRVAALEAASRVHAGRSSYSTQVLNLADKFVEWLLQPESQG
jgi:hypothetical protein